MVEGQHVASTMKLVDGAAEQDVLEDLLERSKHPVPEEAKRLHYLLATPFRYDPPPSGSRFRAKTDPGVFYGAEGGRTAGAELGYWRWRFLMDAMDLDSLGPVPHTAFQARIDTRLVDLRHPPFDRERVLWEHPNDYSTTQSFARIAREAQLGAIVYRSVRDRKPAWCMAIITPSAFASPRPDPKMQSWWLSVQKEAVSWRRDHQSMVFSTEDWRE